MNIDTNGFEIEDEARDRLTGIAGKIIGFHQYATGCARASVQPPAADGKVPDSVGVDVLTLELVAAGPRRKQPVTVSKKGGPRNDPTLASLPRGR
jgi:hypothetical protein